MSKKTQLQTIDPTALDKVSGGASRSSSSGGDDTAITAALTGILDSISSLSRGNQQSGFGMNEMMMFMMMMNRGNQQQVVAAQPQPTNWTWDANGGYWIVK